MATKKQRRRRSKLQRHEYEYVVETDEGEEVVEAPRPSRAKDGAGSKVPPGAVVDRRGRVVPPPSWQRVFKRAAIFGPIMFVLLFALGGNSVSTQAKILNAVFLVARVHPVQLSHRPSDLPVGAETPAARLGTLSAPGQRLRRAYEAPVPRRARTPLDSRG